MAIVGAFGPSREAQMVTPKNKTSQIREGIWWYYNNVSYGFAPNSTINQNKSRYLRPHGSQTTLHFFSELCGEKIPFGINASVRRINIIRFSFCAIQKEHRHQHHHQHHHLQLLLCRLQSDAEKNRQNVRHGSPLRIVVGRPVRPSQQGNNRHTDTSVEA
jgi:hypothetical protein